MQWNFFKEDDNQSGAKRYEDELFNNTKQLMNVERIRRTRRNYLADVFNFKINNADIVHATFQMLAPLKIIKRPPNFILTVHDIIPTIYSSTNEKMRSMWYFIEYAIPKADKIFTYSEFNKNEVMKYLDVDENKIHVVPLGVNDKYILMNKEECRKKFSLDSNTKYILIVSSNLPWKNMQLINEIVDMMDDYKFIKIGYGEILNNSKVINLGYVDEIDMPYLYNACDLYLQTSLYEGGLPVLEAMGCGCPVVSSNSASLPEIIGDSGILLDADKFDSKFEFVENIHDVLEHDNLRKTLIENGLKQAKEFTWERTAKETIDVYNELME